MLNPFASRETYRVHGAAHPSALKARTLALRMERLALAELEIAAKRRRVLSRTPAESLGSERDSAGIEHAQKAGGRRSGDDITTLRPGSEGQLTSEVATNDDPAAFPAMQWRGDRVYFEGYEGSYRTLAQALAAWSNSKAHRLNEHASAGSRNWYPTLDDSAALSGGRAA